MTLSTMTSALNCVATTGTVRDTSQTTKSLYVCLNKSINLHYPSLAHTADSVRCRSLVGSSHLNMRSGMVIRQGFTNTTIVNQMLALLLLLSCLMYCSTSCSSSHCHVKVLQYKYPLHTWLDRVTKTALYSSVPTLQRSNSSNSQTVNKQ